MPLARASFMCTFAVLIFFLVLGIRASPTQSRVVIGYRYVDEQTAAEYMDAKSLTDVQPNGDQLGDHGAYVSPRPNEWHGEWIVVIFADEVKFRAAPKQYIYDEDAFHNPLEIKKILEEAPKAVVDQTILFSKISKIAEDRVQMFIPSHYLRKSILSGRKGGIGDLGIQIVCVPNKPGTKIPTAEDAEWEKYEIPGWRKDLRSRGDPSSWASR
ncbi:hypothetical protein GYMLUDRAFT_730716 [Collybiopsis luxurians FD-317 M1]|nr:hypothetical protein GYMLUDRAFT_730716 [Collybiopsis luxurians FD-317 M1]